MSYKLRNRLEVMVEISSNGEYVEFPLGQSCTLSELNIIESTRLFIPTLYLQVEDGIGFFQQYPLIDGTKIRISMVTQGTVLTQSEFVVYGSRNNFNGSGSTYKIDGYLNAPLYWFASSCECYKATSSSVISQIAAYCGLNSDTVSTADSQLWAQGNRTYCAFVHYLTSHGYRSGTSYLVSAVTADGTLKLRDVNNLTDEMQNVVCYTTKENYYTCTDINITSESAISNGFGGGYAFSLVNQQTNGTPQICKELSVKVNEKNLNLDADLGKAVKRSRIAHGYIRADTNQNFWLGTYQNERYAKVYTVNADLIINSYTKLTPLSRFNLVTLDEQHQADETNSGTYIVVSRCIIIRGANYAERITATRQGMN